MTNTEDARALADDLPFRVNSDGWGDVWIETASGRRIGDLDRRIDADELDAVFARMVDAPALPPPPGVEPTERAYKLFPDEVTHVYEPPPGVGKHPLGKIVVDRGSERVAFVRGWREGIAALPREGVSAEDRRQRGIRLIGLVEHGGAHLCRAEKAEARVAELEAQLAALQPPHPDPACGGEEEQGEVDLADLDHWFAQIPRGPWTVIGRTDGWEVREYDTAPSDKHHWPYRLCESIAGQRAGCDEAVFSFIAAILNAWPSLRAMIAAAPGDSSFRPSASTLGSTRHRRDGAGEPSSARLAAALEGLRTVALAARDYYDGYCQDEADDPEFVGCSDEQHRAAVALRDALKDFADDEVMRLLQGLAAPPATTDGQRQARSPRPSSGEAGMSEQAKRPAGREMTAKERRFFREVYHFNTLAPGPFLVDGPRRGKMAAEMARAGWLVDHGPIGEPIPLGNAYRVAAEGIDAHNAAYTPSETR